MMIPPVLLIGCGRMGGALLAGWREYGLAHAVAIDPHPPAGLVGAADFELVPSADAVPAGFAPAAVVAAVKPQLADEALPPCAAWARGAVVLSIMAGRTIGGVQGLLGTRAIVRAMPNTPATIRQGISVACAAAEVRPEQRALCDRLLQAVGEVAWTEEEALLDPVTAVSGSGPAYVFLLAELLEKAALEQGIPPALATLLARATVGGAGALLAKSEEPAAALRQAVTSRAGTTERALAVLMAPTAWPALVSQAVAAATARSRELAS